MVDRSLQATLITGATGMVGSYVDFGVKLSHSELDITQGDALAAALDKYKPRWVIHLAAETDVDRCEREPDHSYQVNFLGTFNVARLCRKKGIAMVYISTDGVFDGTKAVYTEEDAPNSQSVYGRSKWLGEVMVRDCVPEHLILRAGWMFGGGLLKDRKFVAKIMRQLPAERIHAVVDQRGSAIYAKDLVSVMKALVSEDKRGLYHVCNSGTCSRYELATEIVRHAAPQTEVIPVGSDHFKQAAKRFTSPIRSVRLPPLRPWQEALREYLTTEWDGKISSPPPQASEPALHGGRA